MLKYQKKNSDLQKFIKDCKNINPDKTKKGFNTNLFAEHPFIEGKKIPIFVANFVLKEYGLGAIFGCPAHDQRDLDFAMNTILMLFQLLNQLILRQINLKSTVRPTLKMG